jgi:hypothetical protein
MLRAQLLGNGDAGLSITAPEKRQEEGPAAIDLFEAAVQYSSCSRLFIGDTPAKIDFGDRCSVLLEMMPQMRQRYLDQAFPLLMHVAKRGGEENAELRKSQGHDSGCERLKIYSAYRRESKRSGAARVVDGLNAP